MPNPNDLILHRNIDPDSPVISPLMMGYPDNLLKKEYPSDYSRMDVITKVLGRRDPEPVNPPEMPKPKYTIAIDFDGTVVMHDYPKVGADCPHVLEVLMEIVAHGAGLILHTMRSGEQLDDAIKWFKDREIPLYGIQCNPTQHQWTESRKCYAHLYIDDAALGCPLIFDPEKSKRPFVDWVGVDRLLQKHDWYMEPVVTYTYKK